MRSLFGFAVPLQAVGCVRVANYGTGRGRGVSGTVT